MLIVLAAAGCSTLKEKADTSQPKTANIPGNEAAKAVVPPCDIGAGTNPCAGVLDVGLLNRPTDLWKAIKALKVKDLSSSAETNREVIDKS
ncbi:MAG TPA: hypothetical protein VHV78_15430, partial [Gemmatimonadaceae bacterium]|nr:hypothetical protein [Gemmatimonadaceae bacterium]